MPDETNNVAMEVEGQPCHDGARAFWEAFARIAMDLLDDEASPREDQATEEIPA